MYINKEKYFQHLKDVKKRGKESLKFTTNFDNRTQIWHRSSGHCWYCGKYFDYFDKTYTIDHITAISKGGLDTLDNLVIACKTCNCKKHDKSIEEFRIMYQKINGMIISEKQKQWLRSKNIEVPEPDPFLFYFEKEGLK